jgi:hypothetical protein
LHILMQQMKKTLLLILLLGTSLYTQAQDTTRTTHELGINASGFIKTFITPANSTPLSATANTYLLSYKSVFKNGTAIRFGLGGNLVNRNQNEDNFTGTLKTKTNQFNTRLGFEWQFKVTRRWNFFTGLDAIYSSGTAYSEVPLDNINKIITETKSTSVGGGPVVGLQFRLNKRISLLAEGALYYQNSKTTDMSDIPSFPDNNSKEVTKENSINFTGLQSIFLVITF